MQTYRVYRVGPTGRIMSGDWLKAQTDGEALAMAEGLCEPGSPGLELWQGCRKVADFPCRDAPPSQPRRPGP